MPKSGNITPSKFKDVMTKGQKGEEFGKTALTYASELVMQQLGVNLPEITAPALEWGKDMEPQGIWYYEQEQLVSVQPVTESIQHPEYEYVWGKPDGKIGSTGILELKCPYNSKNHLKNITEGMQYNQYKWQIQGYLWITGREWCDFVSYDPRYPEPLQIAINRKYRDDKLIGLLEERIPLFWEIVQAELADVRSRYGT